MRASEIKVGMWLRNAQGIESQVIHIEKSEGSRSFWVEVLSFLGSSGHIQFSEEGDRPDIVECPKPATGRGSLRKAQAAAYAETRLPAAGLKSGIAIVMEAEARAMEQATAMGLVFAGAPGHRCKVCGGPTYVGLNEVECLAGSARAPPRVEPETWKMSGATPLGHTEPYWLASGRGVNASHPTEEGAIAAWRKAACYSRLAR